MQKTTPPEIADSAEALEFFWQAQLKRFLLFLVSMERQDPRATGTQQKMWQQEGHFHYVGPVAWSVISPNCVVHSYTKGKHWFFALQSHAVS